MPARWKLFGATGAAGVALALFLLGHSNEVSSQPSSAGTPPSQPGVGIPGDQIRNPFEPYEPGRSGIAYEKLSAAEKTGVDAVQEAVETSQPDSSYQAFASAVDWTSAHTEQQLAARAVGLVGAAEEGVVP